MTKEKLKRRLSNTKDGWTEQKPKIKFDDPVGRRSPAFHLTVTAQLVPFGHGPNDRPNPINVLRTSSLSTLRASESCGDANYQPGLVRVVVGNQRRKEPPEMPFIKVTRSMR